MDIPLILLILCLSTVTAEAKSPIGTVSEKQFHLNRQFYKLFTGGLNQLLWDDILLTPSNGSLVTSSSGVSQSCKQSLSFLKKSFEGGQLDAYRFLDSSARAAPALLEGSASSFGDYDECLDISIHDPSIQGQYCLVKFEVGQEKDAQLEVVAKMRGIYPVANFYNLLHGLCIPSACSLQDLQEILGSHVCPKRGLKLLDIFSCDTKSGISFSWTKLSIHQKISLVFIASFVGLCILGSIFHALGINILRHHSMIQNVIDLQEPPSGSRIEVADFFKMGFAIYGVAIHSIIAVVTPIGVYVVSRLLGICMSVQTVWLQPLINVHGLHIISFLGGLAMGVAIYPLILKRKAKTSSLIFQRWLRNVPGMLCLLSLEFLWPVAGSGPLYTYVGKDILNNCHENWFRNVFFFTNYNPVMKNCMNHTFWSSIDFQLFILGVLVMVVLSRNTVLGILFIVAVGLTDFLVTGIVAHVYDTAHAMAAHPITYDSVIKYVDYIHNQTTNYMFTFVMGMSVGIYVVTGKNKHQFPFPVIVFSFIIMNVSAYSTVLYNNYSDYVDRAYIPVYLAVVKILIGSGCALALLFFTATPPSPKKSQTQEIKKTQTPEKETAITEAKTMSVVTEEPPIDWGYRAFLVVSRLSTSLYLVNYWYIRYDFFTARVPYETSVMSFFKRFGYSVCFSEILAFLFYNILLAPMDAYRKMLFVDKVKVD